MFILLAAGRLVSWPESGAPGGSNLSGDTRVDLQYPAGVADKGPRLHGVRARFAPCDYHAGTSYVRRLSGASRTTGKVQDDDDERQRLRRHVFVCSRLQATGVTVCTSSACCRTKNCSIIFFFRTYDVPTTITLIGFLVQELKAVV